MLQGPDFGQAGCVSSLYLFKCLGVCVKIALVNMRIQSYLVCLLERASVYMYATLYGVGGF